MKKTVFLLSLALGFSGMAAAQSLPKVAGSPSYPTTTIVDVTTHSPNHTALATAIQASGLSFKLQEPGPFTFFAPTNDAFGKLPSGTLENLVQSGKQPLLAQMLNGLLVPGRLAAIDLARAVQEGGGSVALKTLNGTNLTVTLDGSILKLTDESGATSRLTQVDLYQKNGIVHVVDGVFMPK